MDRSRARPWTPPAPGPSPPVITTPKTEWTARRVNDFELDVNAFGQPTDIDNNGHIVLFFTRAVNELTPPNAGGVVGGFDIIGAEDYWKQVKNISGFARIEELLKAGRKGLLSDDEINELEELLEIAQLKMKDGEDSQ